MILRYRILLLAGLFISKSVNAAGVWPFFHHDAQRTGLSPYKGADCCYRTCATKNIGSKASVVIDDSGRLFVPAVELGGTGDYSVWCVNTADCSIKWKCVLGQGQMPGNIASSCGISPIDNTIYAGYKSVFYAVNTDATVKWSYPTGGTIKSSPAVDSNGTIYFGCDDTYLYAMNPNGTLKWRCKTGGAVVSSPAIGYDGTIYVGSLDDNLYAINPDSTLKWSYLTGGAVESSPSVGSNGVIYVGSGDGYLYAIKLNGTLKWRYNTGANVQSSPAVDDGRRLIFVGNSNAKIFAIDTAGMLFWQTSLFSGVGYSSPAIANVNDMVYIGDKSGKLYVIQGWNGSIVCYTSHSFFITSPAVDKDDPTKWCVWYNSYDEPVNKICCGPGAVEEGCNCKRIKINLSCQPNPSQTNAKIRFSIPTNTYVSLGIYDLTGRLVEELTKGDYSAGEHTIIWDAKDLKGNIYFCKLKTSNCTLIKKIVLM